MVCCKCNSSVNIVVKFWLANVEFFRCPCWPAHQYLQQQFGVSSCVRVIMHKDSFSRQYRGSLNWHSECLFIYWCQGEYEDHVYTRTDRNGSVPKHAHMGFTFTLELVDPYRYGTLSVLVWDRFPKCTCLDPIQLRFSVSEWYRSKLVRTADRI